tara:strand:+ start:261 stop:722 length:462 start_codon:yes stop_codon:yes gene_type:complete
MDKFNNNIILEMMALSEEVNTLNFKLTQLIRTLNMNPEVLGNAKDLSGRLSEKTKEFGVKMNNYKPPHTDEAIMGTPSYTENGGARERVFPGPDNNSETIRETITPSPVATDETENEVVKKKQTKKSNSSRGGNKKQQSISSVRKNRKPLSNV